MNYSQNREQFEILNYFGSYVGTFIDIGANDGVTLSNTRALAERGWSGILLEPDPSPFEKLKALYGNQKNMYVFQYALSDHNGKATLQASSTLLKTGDTGLVSTFNFSEMDRFKSVVNYTPVEVKTFKWKTALNRWKIKKFDFISLDIEGDEMKVLPDIDLSETRCVCIEWNGNQALKAEYEKYLEGFKLIYTSGENLIYGR